mgnify:CR=1 FL=1
MDLEPASGLGPVAKLSAVGLDALAHPDQAEACNPVALVPNAKADVTYRAAECELAQHRRGDVEPLGCLAREMDARGTNWIPGGGGWMSVRAS